MVFSIAHPHPHPPSPPPTPQKTFSVHPVGPKRKSYWPRCVGTPTKGGAVLMEAIGVIAYHRDKMPTKVILDMNTGRRVDSNI